MERLKVVLTAAVTWITLAAFVLQSAINELGDDFPGLVEPGLRLASILAGIVAVIRRVTPVDESERGIL